MKIFRWIIFAPVFIFYTTLPQHYYETKAKTALAGIMHLDGFQKILSYVLFGSFTVGFFIMLCGLLLIAPNLKLGNRILLGYSVIMYSIAYYVGFNLMSRLDIAFDAIILVTLIFGSFGLNPIIIYMNSKKVDK